MILLHFRQGWLRVRIRRLPFLASDARRDLRADIRAISDIEKTPLRRKRIRMITISSINRMNRCDEANTAHRTIVTTSASLLLALTLHPNEKGVVPARSERGTTPLWVGCPGHCVTGARKFAGGGGYASFLASSSWRISTAMS